MNKWIAEFDLEDGDTMPEHMDLNYMGAKIDFHCRPMWISVSERLPEKSGVYIVTEKEYSVDDREHTGRFNLITEQVEFEDGKWRRANFYEVVAWMTLPEPYKAESEE